jgi:hypothetical protein
MPSFNPSRRTFLKTSVVAGVSVCIVPLADKAALAALFEEST